MITRWLPGLLALLLVGCDFQEVEHEIGHKGKARVNPWLAAERLVERYDWGTRRQMAWSEPAYDDAVWFLPASALTNETYTRQLIGWVGEGGHAVILVEGAEAEKGDWMLLESPSPPQLEPALFGMLDDAGLVLQAGDAGTGGKRESATRIRFNGKRYEVAASSRATVAEMGKKGGVFASIRHGDGRLTVLTDARLFRNRWIGDKDHAALMMALIDSGEYGGAVVFLRGAGLSLWSLMREHLWPVLIGLAVVILLWLWKNLSRFGPVESSAVPSPLREYDHHLEALGDFQWRLDRGSALLAPLRERIIERAQRLTSRAGQRDEDFFQTLADRAGLPRERVFRALAEPAPSDATVLARTSADLQRLLQLIH